MTNSLPFIKNIVKRLMVATERTKREEVTLKDRQYKGQTVKDMIGTKGWQDIVKTEVEASLEQGILTLIRDGLTLTEGQIKAIICDIRSPLSLIGKLEYIMDDGDKATEQIILLERKNAAKDNRRNA